MKNRYPLVCLLALMATACSTMHDRPDGKGDTPVFILPELPLPDDTAIARASSRAIQVYVVSEDGTEDISVDEEPIYRPRNNRDRIVFHLRTGGYGFPTADAVTFPTPPSTGETIDCTTTTSGIWRYREVRCTNPHNIPGTYKYQLNVLRADGTRLTPLDPFIVNR